MSKLGEYELLSGSRKKSTPPLARWIIIDYLEKIDKIHPFLGGMDYNFDYLGEIEKI